MNIGEIIPITDLIEIPALGMKRILEEGSIYGWYGITFDELGGGNYIVTTYFGDWPKENLSWSVED